MIRALSQCGARGTHGSNPAPSRSESSELSVPLWEATSAPVRFGDHRNLPRSYCCRSSRINRKIENGGFERSVFRPWGRRISRRRKATSIYLNLARSRGEGQTRYFSSSLIGAASSLPHSPVRIKHFRRLATRYEKDAANFLAMLKLAPPTPWLGHVESVTQPPKSGRSR